MRLSPQDIDDQINAELDLDPYGISGCQLLSTSTWTWEPFSKLNDDQSEGTLRRVVHRRHGRMPGLDDLERMY